MTTTVQSLPELDLGSAEYLADPYGTMACVREESPLARSRRGLEVLRYRDVAAIVPDRRFIKGHASLVDRLELSGAAEDYHRRMVQSLDGPEHLRLRGPLAKWFTPRQAESMRPVIREIVARELDRVADRDEIDLYRDLTLRIPSSLYCHWVGLDPDEHLDFILRVSEAAMKIFLYDPANRETILAAYDELFPFVEGIVSRKIASPVDDLISDIVREGLAGRLTEREVRDHAIILLEGSTHNTATVMALGLTLLSENQDQWDLLKNDHELLPTAREEIFRYESRTPAIERTAIADMEVLGVPVRAGEKVVVNVRSAHRDPDVFERPDAFDVTRPDRPGALSFGGGAHACLGQNTARVEVEEFVRGITERFPNARVVGTPDVRLGDYKTEVGPIRVRLNG